MAENRAAEPHRLAIVVKKKKIIITCFHPVGISVTAAV